MKVREEKRGQKWALGDESFIIAPEKRYRKPEGDSTGNEGKNLLVVNTWNGTVFGINSKMARCPSEITGKPTCNLIRLVGDGSNCR